MNMKAVRYTILQETPMLYYKILTRIILGIVLALNIGIGVVSQIGGFYFSDAVYSLAIIGLNLYALIALARMQWSGFIALVALCAVTLLERIVLAVQYVNEGGSAAVYAMNVLEGAVSCAVFLIPTWIYFNKRRKLFSPVPSDSGSTTARSSD
jgi:hypothetical protein